MLWAKNARWLENQNRPPCLRHVSAPCVVELSLLKPGCMDGHHRILGPENLLSVRMYLVRRMTGKLMALYGSCSSQRRIDLHLGLLPEWKCLHRGLVRCGSQLDGLSTLAVLGAHAAYPYVGPLVGYLYATRAFYVFEVEEAGLGCS